MHRQAKPPLGTPFQARIHGALLLATCADKLAAPLDDVNLPTKDQLDAALNPSLRKDVPTGAALAQMLICAEHLCDRAGSFDQQDLAVRLAKDALASSGEATDIVVDPMAQGIPWSQSAPNLHNGRDSYGSDAAVRATAVGLVPVSLDAVANMAHLSASITHAHPIALSNAAVVACAVAMSIRGLPNATVTPARFLSTLMTYADHPQLIESLTQVRTLIRHRAGPAEAIAIFYADPAALRVVPAALTAFLRHHQEPVAAIRYAAAIGGHTRAAAVITGALAGGRNPHFQPPQPWRMSCDTMRIHALATGLASAGHHTGR